MRSEATFIADEFNRENSPSEAKIAETKRGGFSETTVDVSLRIYFHPEQLRYFRNSSHRERNGGG